jgi:hypothetical protein
LILAVDDLERFACLIIPLSRGISLGSKDDIEHVFLFLAVDEIPIIFLQGTERPNPRPLNTPAA